jgi:precorrin-2 dehydrogenase/sirohydrochlorin ferrochelatase
MHQDRRYRQTDVRGAVLVIAATSDAEVNRAIARDAACPVNVVDQPEAGTMIVPSVIRRGPLVVAVSTGGASPAAAKTIREELETLYPQAVGAYVVYVGKLRERALKAIPDRKLRERLFRELASCSMLESARTDGYRRAAALARELYMKYTRGTV